MGPNDRYTTGWTLRTAVLLAAAGLTFSQQVTRAQQAQIRSIDDALLRTAAATGDEWLTYGLDHGEKRYSPLTQIDASNVARLGRGVVIRHPRRQQQSSRWREPGSDTTDVERRALRHHDLECRLRRRCADRQATLEVGSGSEPSCRADRRSAAVSSVVVSRSTKGR